MENATGKEVEELLNGDQVVLVDYYAQWCGPCKMLKPRLAEMAKDYPNAKFMAVDVDENTDHAVNMGIRSVPTVMIYKGSELINRSTGVNPDSFYKNILNEL
jgi:thioredoxin 1